MRAYDKKSILAMAGGQIQELIDREMARIVDDILDEDKEPAEKRKLTVTVELKPDRNRVEIAVAVNAKCSFAPSIGTGTMLRAVPDGFGHPVFVELMPEVPGQMDMDEDEQGQAVALRVVRG